MNLILSTLVAIFLSAAICQSVTAIGVSPGREDYWPQLWKRLEDLQAEANKPAGLNPQQHEELEKLLWSDNRLTDAEKLISVDWDAVMRNPNPHDESTRQKLLQHASMSMDLTGYENALYAYGIVLERDRYYNPGKINVGVDLNNIGVAYHLRAISTTDSQKRAEYFSKSLENLKMSAEEFRKLKNDDGQFCSLANEYALLHEMREKNQAKTVFAELKKVDTQPSNEFREMVLEQQ